MPISKLNYVNSIRGKNNQFPNVIANLPKVKSFLDSIGRNSISSQRAYSSGLHHLHNFISKVYSNYNCESILEPLLKNEINVYGLLDSFVSYILESDEGITLRQLSNLKNNPLSSSLGSNGHDDDDDNSQKGRTIEIISDKIGISPKTYQRAAKIIEDGTEEAKKRLRAGYPGTSIFKEYQNILRDERIQKAKLEALNGPELPNNNDNDKRQLHNQDFRNIGPDIIPDNSIDLIFTDPPYNEESVPLYGDLAKLAQRVLKPGGSLITFTRQSSLFEINELVKNNSSLQYQHMFAVIHNGNTAKMWDKRVWPKWKQLLWYFKPKENKNEKGPTMYSDTGDLIESTPPLKELHEWEQSAAEVEYVVKVLTVENQVVLHPLMGVGTTGITSLRLNRKFIGIEIDKEKFEIARHQIHKHSLTN